MAGEEGQEDYVREAVENVTKRSHLLNLGGGGQGGIKLKTPLEMKQDPQKTGRYISHFEVESNSAMKEVADWAANDFDERKLIGMKTPRMEFMEGKTRDMMSEELYKEFYEDPVTKDMIKKEVEQYSRRNEAEGEYDGETEFEKMARGMNLIKCDEGEHFIKKKIVIPGHGPQAKEGQIAYIDFVMSVEEGDVTMSRIRIVDATRFPGKGKYNADGGLRFKLGAGCVLDMFEVSVLSMKEGEAANFLVTWKYGYGENGLVGDEVPKKATLLLEIVLRRLVDGVENLSFWELNAEERKEIPFEEKMKGCQELKDEGTAEFKKENWLVARSKWRKALQILGEMSYDVTMKKDDAIHMDALSYPLFLNIAQSYMNEHGFDTWKKPIQYLKNALDLPCLPPNVNKTKAYYRLAKCYKEIGELDEAAKWIEMAKCQNANDPEIDKLYIEILQKKKKYEADEKNLMKKMGQGFFK